MNSYSSYFSSIIKAARRRSSSDQRLPLPSLGLRVSERKLLLAMGDLFVLNVAMFLNFRVKSGLTMPFTNIIRENTLWFIVVSFIWLTLAVFWNTYSLIRAANALRSVFTTVGAALIVGALYLFISHFDFSYDSLNQPPILVGVLVFGMSFWRLFYATIFVQPMFSRKALIVGAGRAGTTILNAIMGDDGKNDITGRSATYDVIGFVDDDPAKLGHSISGVPVLGSREDLVELVRSLWPDELVLAITQLDSIHPELFKAILNCRELGVTVTTMCSLYESLTGRVAVEHAGRDVQAILPVARSSTHRFYLLMSRLFDIVIALHGCFILLVLIPILWLINRFSSPGNLFYWQKRVGEGGEAFNIVKFRSMVMDAEKLTGAVWARKNDDRITPVGHILRKTRLDELPQFWNVLRGDMSLIGPRPERPAIVDDLVKKIPFYSVRHASKPGITGWAQVQYQYGASIEDALVKLRYDLYYIKHRGFYLDALILLKTVQVVLGMKGQ